jgi:hypothetical protein
MLVAELDARILNPNRAVFRRLTLDPAEDYSGGQNDAFERFLGEVSVEHPTYSAGETPRGPSGTADTVGNVPLGTPSKIPSQ